MKVGNIINIEVDLQRKNKDSLVCELSATISRIDADSLIKKADLAMYEVKCKGGNGQKLYSLEMKEADLDRLSRKIKFE